MFPKGSHPFPHALLCGYESPPVTLLDSLLRLQYLFFPPGKKLILKSLSDFHKGNLISGVQLTFDYSSLLTHGDTDFFPRMLSELSTL